MLYQDYLSQSFTLSFYHCSSVAAGTALKVFREAYLVAGDYPQENMYLLQHLFNNWYRDLAMDKMAAAAVVTGIAIMVLVLYCKSMGKREDYMKKITCFFLCTFSFGLYISCFISGSWFSYGKKMSLQICCFQCCRGRKDMLPEAVSEYPT